MVIDVLDDDMAQGRLVEPRCGMHDARGAHRSETVARTLRAMAWGVCYKLRMYKCMNKGPKGLRCW
jgi:hypothetical protein